MSDSDCNVDPPVPTRRCVKNNVFRFRQGWHLACRFSNPQSGFLCLGTPVNFAKNIRSIPTSAYWISGTCNPNVAAPPSSRSENEDRILFVIVGRRKYDGTPLRPTELRVDVVELHRSLKFSIRTAGSRRMFGRKTLGEL
jgi:hypothetical protein